MDSYFQNTLNYGKQIIQFVFIPRTSLTLSKGSNVEVFLVENGSSPLNFAKVNIHTGDEGLFSIQHAAKTELNIKGAIKIYDQNGCEIEDDDLRHLEDND